MMSGWMRLALPAGLGIVAGMINWWSTLSKLEPVACVRVTGNMVAGEPFAESSLERFDLPGNRASLTETAIPWEERAILYGRPARRSLEPSDLVFWRDATPAPKRPVVHKGEVPLSISLSGMTVVPEFLEVGDQVGFLLTNDEDLDGLRQEDLPDATPSAGPTKSTQYVGSFRIVALGIRTTAAPDAEDPENSDNRVLTVAARFLPSTRQLDAEADRLVAALEGLRGEDVVGVVLHSIAPDSERPSKSLSMSNTTPRPSGRVPAGNY